jgi:hypothetical protein
MDRSCVPKIAQRFSAGSRFGQTNQVPQGRQNHAFVQLLPDALRVFHEGPPPIADRRDP